MFIDSVFRTYVYSSQSWVHHCKVSYRKLALNKHILDFATSRLQTWANLADKWYKLDTLSCLGDVLVLSRQKMVSSLTVPSVKDSHSFSLPQSRKLWFVKVLKQCVSMVMIFLHSLTRISPICCSKIVRVVCQSGVESKLTHKLFS
jgi:hypothetical protein